MRTGLIVLLMCFAVFDSAILAPLLLFRRKNRRTEKGRQEKGLQEKRPKEKEPQEKGG